jgi:hypothetical protein
MDERTLMTAGVKGLADFDHGCDQARLATGQKRSAGGGVP